MRHLCRLLWVVGASLALLAGPRPAAGGDLANAQLLIAGSRLTVTPESQTVPFDTPTIVETHLQGYDPERGVLPQDLRVAADFTGPEVDGILVLETVPNQPFRIPRLRLEGEYRLDNIRLMQGDELLAYAEPRSAAVRVTQVLITRVTSRALTLDEIRSYGIVVNDDSFQAFNFTFAFAVAGETVNYNVPVIYSGPNKEQTLLWGVGMNYEAPPWQASSFRFEPPRMAPFQLAIESEVGGQDDSFGGCDSGEGDCSRNDVVPIPGVILFPTDISLLHQFFSVVLIAQNGAPAGDPLQIHDLTARVTLPPGLRQARTEPPTPLGVPVPVRVPGPDGQLGTGDDLTFLVAQAAGQAEVLVEGMREGTHVVQFDLEGVLHGMPGGQVRRITGQARGAVIVRDPTLNVTITHPDVVRTDEEYTMLLTVTNTGTAPANLLKVRLPLEKLSGVEVVGVNEKTVTILPGDAELVDFRLRSKRTGRVVASAARSSSQVAPVFELTVGVGENGIPLSPNAIILPRATDVLPPDLVRSSLNLVGLGFSLATAPPSLLRADLPRVSRSTVDTRVYELAQMGRHTAFGEEIFDSAAQLAAEWTGARDGDWEWDLLRRTTQKGARVGAALGAILAAETQATSPESAFDRFAKTTGYLPVLQAALATGSGVSLEVASRTGGQRVRGDGNDAARLRELPFADLYRLASDAEMALLAVPEAGGYRARLRAASGVVAGLHVLVPGTDGGLRVVRWEGVSLAAGGSAVAEFRAADTSFVLAVDAEGDGDVDDEIPGSVATLQRRPFQALAAVLNTEVDPTGHVVDVLFTTDVDPAALSPSDPRHFVIPGKVSNGGWVEAEQDVAGGTGNPIENPFEGMRNTRIVRVVFNNPLSPYAPQNLTVAGVRSPLGEQVVSAALQVQIAGAMPGTLVQGKVYGPDGQPVPFAEVELRESDRCLFCEEDCRTHKTAVVRADASGSFLFDYVRQTACSDVYQLKAIDSTTGRSGTATGRVRFVGQTVRLDVVMLGRGTIRGRVAYDDGTVPETVQVIAESPVFREGRRGSVDDHGNYEVRDVPVGTITLSATDGAGRFVVKTVEVPDAGSVVQHPLTILRHPDQPQTTGEVRGVIYRPDGETPVAGAHVALYVDGNLVGVRNSGADGTFDFGPVPAGRGEIETFEGATGQSGVQVFFEVRPDQVNEVDLVMRDERGVVEGHVYRQANGVNTPLFGIIVWAEGTPFKTVTDAQGFYRLEGVFAGTRNISAADLEKKVRVSESVTIGSEGQVVTRNLFFQGGTGALGGIAGEVLGFDGTPVLNATVHLAADDQHWYRTARTDSAGRFALPDLGPGVYGVHAFKAAAGGKAVATVRFAGDTPFVTIRFKKGTIRGVVKAENESGEPVGISAVVTYRTTTVRFELVGLDTESHNLTTAADGSYEIPDVLVGPYVLTVTNSFYGSKTVRSELVENGEVHTQDFLFERSLTGTIRGRVLDYDAVTTVADATVKLHHPSFSEYDLTTDAEGRFTFELVPPTPWGFPIEVVSDDGAIFRKAETWVRFTQRGQELDLEIVLPKQGGVSGRVADANGEPVPGSVVTLQEGSYPRRNLIVNADAGGNFEFHNIFAGTVTLSARAPSLGGLGGKTTVEIVAEGEEVAGVTIFLEPTGRIQGLVTNPVDGAAVASAEVRLLRFGWLFDTINTDPDGRFELTLLPLGTYDLLAFDPRTGRHGRRSGVQVAQNNQVVEGDVELEARGVVDGHLFEPDSEVAVPGATVRLTSYSIASFSTYSSTGADGFFEFLGIPQGRFDLFSREPQGRRIATGGGEIVSEGQRVGVDLFLERQGTITGSVLNPLGAPNGLFPNANTVIWQDGQIVGASLDSEYEFDGIILGHDFQIDAAEIGGSHRGQTTGRLSGVGPVELDVRMRPLGSVVVNVRDSFGNPVADAAVEVINHGFYGYKRFLGDTGADHSIAFQNVGEGQVTAYATNPVTGLRGSASALLTHEGQIVEINLALESSGQIQGTVVLADGETPAANALVVLQIAGRTLTTFTGGTGDFLLPSVPLGSFFLVFQESFGPGIREIRGSLTTNGQVLNLGTVILDAVNPRVVEVTPATGAVDLPLNTKVVVRFSEPMDTTRASPDNQVRFQTSAGQDIGATYLWIDGNTAVQATPNQPLQNFTTYRVRVVPDRLFDTAGRRLEQGVQASFTTADVVGPVVIESSPVHGARQVPLDAPLRVTFNEAFDYFSVSGTAVQLADLTAGGGVSTTFMQDPGGRILTITAASGLIDGHRYQLTVQEVEDRVGNPMLAPFSVTFQAKDSTPPAISGVQPPQGSSFTSGERMTVSATVTDLSAVTGVTLRIGDWALTDASAPYSWDVPAPVVATEEDVEIRLEALDEWGNQSTAAWELAIEPRTNANAPEVEILCSASVAPASAEVEVGFHIEDDENVESYRLKVNGQTVASMPLADRAVVDDSFLWMVPVSASAGDVFTLRIEAVDFAGNVGSAETTVTVDASTLLTGDRTLGASYAGQSLTLSKGTFTLSAPLSLASLNLIHGARLLPATGGSLALVVTGRLAVGCGALVDVSGMGYAGGSSFEHQDGEAPPGVVASKYSTGGSHGGRGQLPEAGEVYDSVYAPRQGGRGGGFFWTAATGSLPGGAGGGVVRIEASQMELGGEIRAQGQAACGGGGGAGGTVSIVADVVSGAGTIDASGGSATCAGHANGGGGGRVSIVAESFDGFDPAQVKAWGGGAYNLTSFAAPGTIFTKTAGQTYGALLIDPGTSNGADRAGLRTELPVLGSGTVTGTEISGSDLWVSAGSGFAAKWLGAWMRLRNATGGDLGVYRVVEIDASGRVRLAGAAGVSGLAGYQGEYRFDRVELKHGADLDALDPLASADTVVNGEVELAGGVTGATVTVRSGSVVRPVRGGELRLSLSGKLTIETGARLDVSGLGYEGGGTFEHPQGYAPPGVVPSQQRGGGSHGGRGQLPEAGEVYDSVYAPRQGGGGGGFHWLPAIGSLPGGAGGGVVRIEAGEVELAGEIRALGQVTCGGGGGAGGTVSIVADLVSGAGTIDASGGSVTCAGNANGGGGGRVSIVAESFTGFDPAAQVKAWGGGDSALTSFAAPGTIFTRTAGESYGGLLIDAGGTGEANRACLLTELPALGSGVVTGTEASDADLWVSAEGSFQTKWLGAWVNLRGAAAVDLGFYRVTEIDAAGRLRLAGAAGVSGAVSYKGEYRFDRVELKHGAGLQAADPIVGPEVVLEGNVQVSGEINAANVRVKSGAVVRPASGGELRIVAAGRLALEAGALLDVSGLGYGGGTDTHPDGYAPPGVMPSKNHAGGSHGGRGQLSDAGDVYDSVYAPRQAGGGGSFIHLIGFGGFVGGAGGGVVRIEAGEVELAGDIRALGQSLCNPGLGAGGTVAIVAGVVSGGGTIDVSGGDMTCGSAAQNPGGGGRVSIVTGTFNGFDPASQVKAWGGANFALTSHAAAGTIFTKESGESYGALLIDPGTSSGADRVSLATELPVLGGGTVTDTEVSGGDLWVSASAGFAVKWLGAWMRLRSATGADLGVFPVAEIDASGRVRLAGASGVSGASSYQGEYRFDRVELKHGAGLDAHDPLLSMDTVVSGEVELPVEVTGATATVRGGSVVRPVRGGELRLSLSGKLTLEAAARLDVSGLGYKGGTSEHPEGLAPNGVVASQSYAGGSHGGRGQLPGAGEVYDSVYEPRQAGGGGGHVHVIAHGSFPGGAGGGVVRIEAGEVELAGEIRALGQSLCAGGGGAGGTVAITSGLVSGPGTIDASGASVSCAGHFNPGGGGRVSIVTGSWNGFDPVAQVKAWGGADYPVSTFAGAGTIYTKSSGQNFGSLRVDQGRSTADSVVTTVLPAIGKGIVGAISTDAGDPSALWIEPQDVARKFDVGAVGMWVRVAGVDYPVIAQSDDRRRLLLAGAAGAVSVGQSYVGFYKLDSLTVTGRANLAILDGVEAASTSVTSGSTLTVLDLQPPTLSVTQPAAGALYYSGQTVQITVQASDPGGVTSVTFRLGEQSFVDTAAPYEWSVSAPAVETEGDVPITVEAVDTNDNRSSVSLVIRVRPQAPGDAPAVSFSCPSPGALLAPGTGVDLSVAASHENGIERVDLLLGATVLSTDFSAPFTFRFTAPSDGVDGQVLTLKARARSFSNTTAEVSIDLRLVQGTVFTADHSVAEGDTSLENASVIVAGGTLIVTGPHTFRDLVVLDGARVTHVETTATQEARLELTLQRDLYVACGGAIDVTGRGFLGSASSGQRAYGFGNTQTEGADPAVGGSYGGRGGQFNGSGPVYGSFYDPRDAGAGGGHASGKGRDGGGVLRVTAGGDAVVDGSVLSNGETGASGAGGAGGSIRINADAIRGAGSIHASGSVGGGGTAGGGSGGRIALYAAVFDAGLLGRTLAAGAATSSTDPATWGAAGTIFIKPDAQALGDLILDNAGAASSQYTELLVVGRGVIDAVASDGFTDDEADFRHLLGTAEVAFNGDFGTLYAILGHAHHGTSLSLDVPVPPLSAIVEPGDTYEGIYRFNSVVVRNGARGIALDRVTSGNAPGSGWTESYTPSIQLTSPAAGSTFTSGDDLTVSADVQDVLGIQSVTFQLGSQVFVDTAAPYTWATSAPTAVEATDLEITALARDLSGNRFGAVRTIHVEPAVDPNAPVVALTGCLANGDFITPGAQMVIPFTATDNDAVQSYSLVVDGVTQQTVNVNQATVSASFNWTPPAGAAPGAMFNVRVEANDFAGGVGFVAITLNGPPTTPLTGTQNLTSALNGQTLILGAGTFTVTEPISLASLSLLSGARVVGLSGQTLSLTVAGTARVQCGGLLDVSHLGYGGGLTDNASGGAPAGVAGSTADAGGSHGGVGQVGQPAGLAGATYGSVYEPGLGGGGGSLRYSWTDRRGGSGGGTLVLTAGALALGGEIRARGEKRQVNGASDSSGAGGSVLINAGVISGAGTIDASGGDYRIYYYWGASGGGGRVAIYADTLSAFDPALQVNVRGGALTDSGNTVLRYAGPGTVLVKQPGNTYGRLIVDSGEEANGTDRVGLVTPLPVLGAGSVSSFEAAGADAWVNAAVPFKAQWVGAWMALKDTSGTSLGSFRVAQLDGSGRALLAGAGTTSGVVSYAGQYRFDRVDLRNGAGLSSQDDEIVVGDVFADGGARLPTRLTATNVTLKNGAVAVPASGGELRATVSGTLTIEPGARLDVSHLGYAGGPADNSSGGAPAGVAGSAIDAGGSHGGVGQVGELTGPAGETYGSVYEPQLGGGGGSLRYSWTDRRGGNGGGVLVLDVGELALGGEIRARGEKRQVNGSSDSGGAGGSVLITADVISGVGTIDASGGDYRVYYHWGASGGGGRVALYADTFSGFDPALQVKAQGGALMESGNTVLRYAGPGTILVKQPEDTYGRLIVDSGEEANGTDRVGLVTPLPLLGTGSVLSFEAAGADAWVSAAMSFKAQWVGTWMTLQDTSGASLGSFRVAQLDGTGRALLAGAGAASGVVSYAGQYRFDRVDLKNGAGLSSQDEMVVGDVFAEGGARLPTQFTATNMTLKSGAVAVPASGGELRATVSGTLTIETGARLDVSHLGYSGGATDNSSGGTPAGVTGPAIDAGGSHGGVGQLGELTGPAGETYGSVYQPQLAGGGGPLRYSWTGRRGGSGGGVLVLNVGELALAGEIRAQGEKRQVNGASDSSGAGGSVLITADVISGTGLIDASGGDYRVYYHWGASGGGGRVAFYVDSFSGFDPATQVKARGGALTDSGNTVLRYASPGTVFVKPPSQTFGTLYVDQGGISGKPIVNTPLPSIGVGTIGTVTVDTFDTEALWIEPSTPTAKFALGAVGLWVRINNTDYRVLDQTSDRRKLLLDGAAGAVQAGDGYRGVYKFDEVIVRGGSKLEFRDTNVVGTFTVDSTSSVIQNVP